MNHPTFYKRLKKQYTVRILPEDCKDGCYINNTDCPLHRAIRRQLPRFPLVSIGGNYVRDTNYRRWQFVEQGAHSWNSEAMNRINMGELTHFDLTFKLT